MTAALLARVDTLLARVDGFDGEFRFIPTWEGDNGGPMVANSFECPDSIYFIPRGAEFDPNYPTDDGCVCISEELDERAAAPLVAILNDAPDLLADLRDALTASEAECARLRWTAWLLMWQAVGCAHSEAVVVEMYVDAMENRRNVCAHCQAAHDVPSGAMAAHVRACEKNPLVGEIERLRGLAGEAAALLDAVPLDDMDEHETIGHAKIDRAEHPWLTMPTQYVVYAIPAMVDRIRTALKERP